METLFVILAYIVGGVVVSCFSRWVEDRLNHPGMPHAWYGMVTAVWPVMLPAYLGIWAVEGIFVPLLARFEDSVEGFIRVASYLPRKVGKFTDYICPHGE